MSEARLKFLARCFIGAICAHNFEEWWGAASLAKLDAELAARVGLKVSRPPPEVFESALVVATIIPAALLLACTIGRASPAKAAGIAFVVGLFLVNVFVPHLAASLAYGGYTPGIATALLINLPLGLAIEREIVRTGALSRAALALTLVASTFALPFAIAAAYAAARLVA